jgi:hypothetical protein
MTDHLKNCMPNHIMINALGVELTLKVSIFSLQPTKDGKILPQKNKKI